jgi:hypothetical protein
MVCTVYRSVVVNCFSLLSIPYCAVTRICFFCSQRKKEFASFFTLCNNLHFLSPTTCSFCYPLSKNLTLQLQFSLSFFVRLNHQYYCSPYRCGLSLHYVHLGHLACHDFLFLSRFILSVVHCYFVCLALLTV